MWVSSDSTGNYLYVLDSESPAYNGTTDLNGSLAVYSIDGSTGRLQIVPNQSIKNAAGQQLNYFEVGPSPTMFRVGGCVYTLDSGDQTIYPYGIGSGGQLVVQANATTNTGAQNLTSINVSGSNVYLTDAGKNQILPYTQGSGCSLSVQADGIVNNLATTSDPVYSIRFKNFLYVLNHGNTSNANNANSTISAFVIQTTGALTPISDAQNPYSVGNGPICMAEDPSSQYIYTSNSNDGSVTGKFINQNTGQLSALSRGSNFSASGLASCLAISGNVD